MLTRVCSFCSSARWVYFGIALMSLAALACQEDPVRVEPPDTDKPPEPFVEYRTWRAPQPIDGVPDVFGRVSPHPLSLSTSAIDELHLLMNIPADSMLPHNRYRLGYLHYDGVQWRRKAEVDGYGLFAPLTGIATAPGRVHFFWAGITADRQQEWIDNRRLFATDLFHCVWSGAVCSEPVSLSSTVHEWISFSEPVQDGQGRIHLITDTGPEVFHLILEAQGQLLSKNRIGFQSQPSLLVQGDTLHFVYMSGPLPGTGGANDLYYEAYHEGAWTEPVVIFHDVDKDANHPRLVIDENGLFHLVFYVTDAGGPSTQYMHSEDRGRTWTEPELLHRFSYLPFRAPKLGIDGHGILHVTWSHLGSLRSDSASVGIESYYAARRDGQWSAARRLFPELEPKSEAHLVVDANNIVHVIVLALDKNIYHARFE